jgi:ActR/RegA family two-component response regulator
MPAAPKTGSGDVLVVEDDPMLALALTEALEDAGLEVAGPCLGYRQALVAIARKPPTRAVIDVDLGSGDLRPGFEGERLLAILDKGGCRCVVYSGRSELFEPIARAHPDVVFISKPASVTRVVEAVLGEPASDRGPAPGAAEPGQAAPGGG